MQEMQGKAAQGNKKGPESLGVSMSINFLSHLVLLRPVYCILSIAAVLFGGALAARAVTEPVLLAALSVFLITAGGNVLHDYFDFASDKLSNPKRPLPSGKIKPRRAVFLALLLLVFGILSSMTLNFYTMGFVLLNIIVILAYTSKFQGRVLAGNAFIGYLTGSTFIYGGLSVLPSIGQLSIIYPALLLGIAAMFANFGRGVVKDLESMQKGRMGLLKVIKAKIKHQILKLVGKARVLPIDYTNRTEREFVALALILAMLISFMPFKIGLYGQKYMVLAGLGDLSFLWAMYTLFGLSGQEKYRKANKWIKVGMAITIAAFFVGTFL